MMGRLKKPPVDVLLNGQADARIGDNAKATAPPPVELQTTALAQVKPKPVKYLVPNMLPKGKLVVGAGPGGVGKSSVTLSIASSLSRGVCCCGLDYPDPVTADTLLIVCEDDPEDTLVPRLLAHGADMERIHLAEGVLAPGAEKKPFTLADVEPLTLWLEQHPACKLVVVDPATAFVGAAGIDDHRDAELRSLLGPLAVMAAARDVCVVLILHINKAAAQSAVNRVLGGVGYVNAARAAYLVVPAREDPDMRLMLPIKSNLSPDRKGLKYRTVPLAQQAGLAVLERFEELSHDDRLKLASQLYTVVWQGSTDVSADDALTPPEKKKELSEEAVWLRDWMGGKPVLAREAFENAKKADITEEQLRRAQKELGVKAKRESGKQSPPWYWIPSGVAAPWDPQPDQENGRVWDAPQHEKHAKHAKDAKDATDPEDGRVGRVGRIGHVLRVGDEPQTRPDAANWDHEDDPATWIKSVDSILANPPGWVNEYARAVLAAAKDAVAEAIRGPEVDEEKVYLLIEDTRDELRNHGVPDQDIP